MTEFTKQEIKKAASSTFYCSDLGTNYTVKSYLIELLRTLWDEGEGFNGKRPFGNSGWEFDIYKALVKNGCLEGKLNEDDDLIDCNCTKGNELVFAIINSFL